MKSARSAPVRAAGDLVFFVAGGLIFACSVQLFAAPNLFLPAGLTALFSSLNFLQAFPFCTIAVLP